ncbi:hypothetical protein HPT28_00945 [Streptomyces sp. JJ38]|nr:hypothetical protein [Streptomyces sp. JJ38]
MSLTLEQARRMLFDTSAESEARHAVWLRLAELARRDTDRERWPLAAVWVGLPGLYRTVFRIVRRLRAEVADVEAELLVGYLEALREIGPETPDPGTKLLRTACRRAWEAARSGAGESAVEDVEATAAAVGTHAPEGVWQAEFDAPGRPDGLTASVRITVPAHRVEGVRVGALARAWGLSDVATGTELPRRGRRVGSLSLRSVGRRT